MNWAQHIKMDYAPNLRKCLNKAKQTIFRIFQNSERNLVMHFHKTVYIPCFNNSELLEALVVGHYTSKKGTFVLMPLYQTIPIFNKKNLICKSRICFTSEFVGISKIAQFYLYQTYD